MLDGHIHVMEKKVIGENVRSKLSEAGIAGGIVISLPPPSFYSGKFESRERLDYLFECMIPGMELYPFYWIDPLEEDAAEQVRMAEEYGVSGFKVICNNFYPDDPRAMKVFEAITGVNKPILFHSGILWDGAVSSKYNRPAGFEALLQVDGLKFALAHASWPWIDECIAVYGKFQNAYSERPDLSVEMFIDITPGTPVIYREELLTKLFTVGYDIENNIIFGSDCNLEDYNSKWAREWIDRDNEIYRKLSLEDRVIEQIYSKNLRRFLGIENGGIKKSALVPGK